MVHDEVLAIASKYLKKISRVGGDNISALCPFHAKPGGREERHPSFSMSLSKGVWHCFTCHESGTFQSFLTNVGVSKVVIAHQYGEIFEILKKNYTPAFDPIRPKVNSEDPLPESLLGSFDQCPLYLVDPLYSAYLDPDDPGVFDEEVIRQYDIGFDDIHERITFPLRDLMGNLVGISGRTVTGAYPRYKVYDREYLDLGYPARSQTQKGAILWNAHRVYPGLFMGSPQQYVVVVEGFRGCLWAIQCGIKNTVALLGSNLSRRQQWILERMGCKVYLMLDNDEAGQKALCGWVDEEGRKRPGMAEVLNKTLDVSVISYTGKQPTMLTQEALVQAVASADQYYAWVARKKKEIAHGVR